MTATGTVDSAHIHAFLAENGYEVTDSGPNVFSIRQIDSGVTIQGVLEGDILYFSATLLTTAESKLTREILRKMLGAESGISTSHFQLYDMGGGQTAVALANYCKLQDMGLEDEDDILSCVHFLFADVVAASQLLGELG